MHPEQKHMPWCLIKQVQHSLSLYWIIHPDSPAHWNWDPPLAWGLKCLLHMHSKLQEDTSSIRFASNKPQSFSRPFSALVELLQDAEQAVRSLFYPYSLSSHRKSGRRFSLQPSSRKTRKCHDLQRLKRLCDWSCSQHQLNFSQNLGISSTQLPATPRASSCPQRLLFHSLPSPDSVSSKPSSFSTRASRLCRTSRFHTKPNFIKTKSTQYKNLISLSTFKASAGYYVRIAETKRRMFPRERESKATFC